MQSSSRAEHSGQFHSGGDQWIGSTINTSGGNVNVSAPEHILNVAHGSNRFGDNARTHFRDQYDGNRGVIINANNTDIDDRILRQLAQLSLDSPPARKTFGLCLGQAPQIEQDAFIGRTAEIRQLQGWFPKDDTAQRVTSIFGMGGIGKTQLALAYARGYGQQYTSVFWVNAKDESSLRHSMSALARVILDDTATLATNAVEEQNQVELVKRWLSEEWNHQWLLMFDNYDDPKLPNINSATGFDIRLFFPYRAQGHILITTRSPKLTFGRRLMLQKLDDPNLSLAILSQRAVRDLTTDKDARKLAVRLDGLPLALATAGTYLGQTKISCREYLRIYESAWIDLYGPDSEELLEYEGRTLSSTWTVSLDQVCRLDNNAADLFKLLAFFGNKDIWYELFRRGADSGPAWIGRVTATKMRFDRAMTKLQDYSLVEATAGSYSIHPCIHDWVAEHFDTHQTAFLIALICVGDSIPDPVSAEYWTVTRRLLAHVDRLSSDRFRVHWEALASNSRALRIGNDFGGLLLNWGQSDQAEKVYQRVLAGREQSMGLNHISSFKTVHDLGLLYGQTGKLDQAKEMFQRALAGYEHKLGPNDLKTLHVVHNLGILYRKQGKLDEAGTMFQRALTGKEQLFGPDHITTLNMVYSIGVLYRKQGKLDEADKMFQRALRGKEQLHGRDHIMTLDMVYSIGVLYCKQGKLDQAEEMYQRALAGRQQILGPDHRKTLDIIYYLGCLYMRQDKLGQAEAMFRRVLVGFESTLGADHPATADAVKELKLLEERKKGRPTSANII